MTISTEVRLFDLMNRMVMYMHRYCIHHDELIQLNDMQDYRRMKKIFLNNEHDEDI